MKVNISPGVGIIKIFKALDYESWFAIAEYIDNSISSYLTWKDKMIEVEPQYSLRIKIDLNFNDGVIEIRDNAGGIEHEKYEYAFRAAEIPDDTTGLNEFGMGMKTASSWLANKWTIETSAFGEDVSRTIEFNVNDVVQNNINELEADESSAAPDTHYTLIRLEELTGNAPQQKDLKKIKKHLASIHRKFIRDFNVEILVNDELLSYEGQPILVAPRWDKTDGESIEWKIDIDQSFGTNKRVTGFIALLDTMSTSVHNGFSLFRRGRVIEGSGDDLYRPKELSGSVGSHQFKRVFGELELEGFKVDFTKGKFIGDKDFEQLLFLLQDYADSDDFPILRQGRNYRKPQPKTTLRELAKKGAKEYKEAVNDKVLEKSIEGVLNSVNDVEKQTPRILEKNKLEEITEDFLIHDERWVIELSLTDSPEITNWLDVLEDNDEAGGIKKIRARLSLIHPFMSSFGTDDIQPYIRLAFALILAESTARISGGNVGTVRKNLNKFLKSVLAN